MMLSEKSQIVDGSAENAGLLMLSDVDVTIFGKNLNRGVFFKAQLFSYFCGYDNATNLVD